MKRRTGSAACRALWLLGYSKFRSDSRNGKRIGCPTLASMYAQHEELSDKATEATNCGSAGSQHHLMHGHGLSHRLLMPVS